MALQITTTQKVKVRYVPTTEGTSENPGGLPAPIDGNVQWNLLGNNTSGARLEPITDAPNQSEAWFISGNEPQAEPLTISGKADVDMDGGESEVRELEVTDTATVIAAEAAGAVLESGAPEPK